MHHLVIALHVGGNENDLCPKTRPCVFEELHGIWSSSPFLRVPKYHSLRFDVVVNESAYRWAKSLLLVWTYPDKEPNRKSDKGRKHVDEFGVPIWALNTGGQRGPNTGSSANTDPSFKHCRCMANTSYNILVDYTVGSQNYHTELEFSCPYCFGWIGYQTFCEVALNATYHIMTWSFATLANNSKSVVLHNRCTTNST